MEPAKHEIFLYSTPDGVVRVEVADAMWMQQMIALRSVLQREMARIAGLPISAIHFELKKH